PPALHPFPTRRSSDLAAVVRRIRNRSVAGIHHPARDDNAHLPTASTAAGRLRVWRSEFALDRSAAPLHTAGGFPGKRNRQGLSQDRKSTRLNSSHVKI